jgi:hypothetical protein
MIGMVDAAPSSVTRVSSDPMLRSTRAQRPPNGGIFSRGDLIVDCVGAKRTSGAATP